MHEDFLSGGARQHGRDQGAGRGAVGGAYPARGAELPGKRPHHAAALHRRTRPGETGRGARQQGPEAARTQAGAGRDRKSTRLNSSHSQISYAVFCLKKKKTETSDKSNTICKTTSAIYH